MFQTNRLFLRPDPHLRANSVRIKRISLEENAKPIICPAIAIKFHIASVLSDDEIAAAIMVEISSGDRSLLAVNHQSTFMAGNSFKCAFTVTLQEKGST